MTYKDEINNEYFNWMVDAVSRNMFSKEVAYRKLLAYLHYVEFTYIIPKDENRAEDGIDLRYRFSLECNHTEDEIKFLDGPCSILEMMVALSLRCEETIMDDPAYGNRTGYWFWGMITSLGLGSMIHAETFDKQYVEEVIERFLNRDYEPNGKGGLFTIKNCDRDLRGVEIWYQLCYYLNTIA